MNHLRRNFNESVPGKIPDKNTGNLVGSLELNCSRYYGYVNGFRRSYLVAHNNITGVYKLPQELSRRLIN